MADACLRSQDTDFLAMQLAEMPAFRALIRATESRLLAGLGVLPGPVLDLGCGDGHFARTLFATPVDVGVDPSLSVVAEADRQGVYRLALAADAGALPFADDAFGSVLSNCVLEHIPDLRSAMRETARVLRPGGQLAITVPSAEHQSMLAGGRLLAALGLHGPAAGYRRWFERISRHYNMHDVPEWSRLLAEVGMEVVWHRYYFSARTVAVFEAWHYLSAPSLLTRRVTGRWVAWPGRRKTQLLAGLLRARYEEPEPRRGAYLALLARRI